MTRAHTRAYWFHKSFCKSDNAAVPVKLAAESWPSFDRRFAQSARLVFGEAVWLDIGQLLPGAVGHDKTGGHNLSALANVQRCVPNDVAEQASVCYYSAANIEVVWGLSLLSGE